MKSKKSILINAIIVLIVSITIVIFFNSGLEYKLYLNWKKEQRIKDSGYDKSTYNYNLLRYNNSIGSGYRDPDLVKFGERERRAYNQDVSFVNNKIDKYQDTAATILFFCILGSSLIILISLIKPFKNKFIPALKQFIKQIYD